MPASDFKIQIKGRHAEEVAKILSELIKKEFGYTPERVIQEPKKDTEKVVDPLTIAAIIITIPPALVATLDLIERRKTRDKLDLLIELVKKQQEKTPDTQTSLITPDGISKPIVRLNSLEIIEAAAKIMKKK